MVSVIKIKKTIFWECKLFLWTGFPKMIHFRTKYDILLHDQYFLLLFTLVFVSLFLIFSSTSSGLVVLGGSGSKYCRGSAYASITKS